MSNSPSTLIVPVESQVRELDAKILLSCVAAERGFPVVMGSRAFVHFQAASIPRGVYLAKSMRGLSTPVFRILRQLGHEIVAWEEEALVHPPAETYFTLRLSPTTVKHVSHIFTWGQDNVDLLRQYPELPHDIPIHTTGNPRGDMLRSETRGYFDADVASLRQRYGEFILVNTNFSDVNPFIANVGLFLPPKAPGQKPRFGQAGLGMRREFAEGLHEHKQSIFEDFKQLIPALEQAFPNLNIVVRPHPSESFAAYREVAAQCQRVQITNDGNIVPWLLATKALVHNGCTTAVEAFAVGVPAAAYLATFDHYYDYEFQGLPNRLSHECRNFEALRKTLIRIMAGEVSVAEGKNRKALIDHYIAARTGPLACDRVIDVLEESGYRSAQPPSRPPATRLIGSTLTWLRAKGVQINMRRPGPNRLAYHDHRFPEIAVAEIQRKVDRFKHLLNRFDGVRVAQHSKHVFKIDA